MSNDEDEPLEITTQEWLNHIRRISRRVNGIIGHVVTEHQNPLRAKSKGWVYKRDQRTAWAMCKIRHEAVGWCNMVISFWGSHSVEVYVLIPFGESIHKSNISWGVKHSYGNIDMVGKMFSTASEYQKQVDRIVKLMLPLQALFSRDKLQWMIGELELDKLEHAANKPARRKRRAMA